MPTSSYSERPQPTPDEALARLLEGNARFASNVRSIDSLVSHLRRAELAAGQRPFAVIVGCSDSRVVSGKLNHAGQLAQHSAPVGRSRDRHRVVVDALRDFLHAGSER